MDAPAQGQGRGLRLGIAGDDQHEFTAALVGIGRHRLGDAGQVRPQEGFEALGQFARQHGRPGRTEGGCQIGQGIDNAMAGLVENQGPWLAGQLRQAGPAGGRFWWQEAFKAKPVAGQPGRRQRSDGGAGAGDWMHGQAGVARRRHQPVTRIADQRRAGVADQGNRRTVAQPRQQGAGLGQFVVFVQGQHRRVDTVMVQQHARAAGVLAGNDIDLGQHRQRALGNIGQIADRRGHDVQGAGGYHGAFRS